MSFEIIVLHNFLPLYGSAGTFKARLSYLKTDFRDVPFTCTPKIPCGVSYWSKGGKTTLGKSAKNLEKTEYSSPRSVQRNL